MLVSFASKKTFANLRKTCPEFFPRTSTAAVLKNNGFCHPIVLGSSFSIKLRANTFN
jgi:hypothetical protein